MGSTSGKPGASRHRRGGDGERVRTSLVGGDRRGEYRPPSAPDNRSPEYGAPQHGAPQYGAPQSQYGAPQSQYGAPQNGAPGYGTREYGAAGYRTPDGRGARTVLPGFVEPEREGALARLTALLRREDAAAVTGDAGEQARTVGALARSACR